MIPETRTVLKASPFRFCGVSGAPAVQVAPASLVNPSITGVLGPALLSRSVAFMTNAYWGLLIPAHRYPAFSGLDLEIARSVAGRVGLPVAARDCDQRCKGHGAERRVTHLEIPFM